VAEFGKGITSRDAVPSDCRVAGSIPAAFILLFPKENLMQSVADMLGATIIDIQSDNDEVVFTFKDGRRCKLYHEQDCCEHVYLEDICGDLADLLNEPLTMAEEIDGEIPNDFEENGYDSYTWTFYKFATIKGYVTLRWLGRSNGYYSETVQFTEI
jgi:hypothetical protein